MKNRMTIITVAMILLSAATVLGATQKAPLLDLQETISRAVANIRPSVVSVRAQKSLQTDAPGQNGQLWFESIGSGFVVDERGYVLTNLHVVNGSKNIEIKLWRSGNNTFPARIVDKDSSLDLALLKIDSNEVFSPAALGNSDRLETGDHLICIGSPFGFNHSVTWGIVSNLNKQMTIDGVIYKDMIQTDAVINEGNSGGPIIGIDGRVIGISTAIYAPDGTYTGLGFAIPINRVKHFFSRFTGALITVAAKATKAPAAKEPINMNKPMPNDKIHQEFSDCTKCHTITQKSVVSIKAQMPHPPLAGCDTCHIITRDKVAKGPVAVAATRPMTGAADWNPKQLPHQTSTADMPLSGFIKIILLKLGLITFVSSIIFTMMGLGGGFVYVPLLLSCGIDFYTAATTSLVILTFSKASSLYVFFKSGMVDLKLTSVLIGPVMIGAFTGGILAHHFNVDLLSILFACMLFLASYFMMQDKVQTAGGTGQSFFISSFGWHHEFNGNNVDIDLMLAVPLTFIVGYIGGMLGLAAGWIMIPLMVLMFNIPMKIAIATSSLIVPFTGLAGFLGHSFAGNLDLRLAVTLSIIAVIGAQIGSRVSIGTQSGLLRFIFAFILSLVGLWMILRIF